MVRVIKKLKLASGETLINVPADRPTLIALGFDEIRADELCLEAENSAKLESVISARRTLYVTEADPLFLEWQYDETPEKEKAWRDKVAEIKALYPLPDRT
ncbi:hypothetical protein IFT37_02135 [Pseudomonas fluorescens]|uniref:Uncharacterized protein n=1 Tax=Pseudomonas fluorescens TaxID=294 RepID=A0AAE2U101_PSEFL|nr:MULTISPECIES: hypothetical protein [Pseudomonas fluorescens group]MBA1429582.1 hypothetical protein [Pseudomonas orientalis]MBD8146996.1 hypothetical protein [Pseudomonas fluorescens]MBD8175440.1 hypothetical protein [Pseudomonas fluorescens]MBD8268747.1 hypothetical protein [Pseudomonas fluorescens]MBD8743896.1 hypothetical protein [Pseudomonas fluorescens]